MTVPLSQQIQAARTALRFCAETGRAGGMRPGEIEMLRAGLSALCETLLLIQAHEDLVRTTIRHARDGARRASDAADGLAGEGAP